MAIATIVAAIIGIGGTLIGAAVEQKGIEDTNAANVSAAQKANLVTNRQWERENKREDDRFKLEQGKETRQKFQDVLNNSAGLKSSLIDVWGGKGGL